MPIQSYPNIIYPTVRLATGIASVVGSLLTEPANPKSSGGGGGTVRQTEEPETGFAVTPPPDISKVSEKSYFPIGGPAYTTVSPGIPITPSMHFYDALGSTTTDYDPRSWKEQMYLNPDQTPNAYSYDKYKARPTGILSYSMRRFHNMTYAQTVKSHITMGPDLEPLEWIQGDAYEYPMELTPGTIEPYGSLGMRNSYVYQFRGAVTFLNPEKDEEKQHIMDFGLELTDRKVHPNDLGVSFTPSEEQAAQLTPTTPLHPFTRSFPDRARSAIITSYNRTKLPVADIEHRKAFRHIFITRPECYLMASTDQPSMQAMNDEDMNTCWLRMPHVLRALSPVYVTQCVSVPHYANWNFLLSNRVQGMTTGANTLTTVDSMTKGVRGATVLPGKNLTSNLGGSLELQFTDTKYMDVYEMLRIWMLYIHKRRTGQFFPPFNGYQYENAFYPAGSGGQRAGGFGLLHPYDRALEYCASVFDIVTNESGTKILYWCKYYGLYPTNVTSSILANTKNAALTGEATVSATFQYQYKQENLFKNLVEFNYNAGLVDSVGKTRSDVTAYLRNSVPFLYREDGKGGTSYTTGNLRNYKGAAGMFTGSPYIMTEMSGSYDPWRWGSNSKIVQATLGFIPLFYGQPDVNAAMNLGITNENIPSSEARQSLVLNY